MKKDLIVLGEGNDQDLKSLQESFKYTEEDNEELMKKYDWI